MKVFMSYSRRNDAAVKSLIDDLQPTDVEIWRDAKLRGGDAWWTEILEQIRKCNVFLFAVSDSSLHSKPCRAELGYAQSLGLPILPVQLGDVASYHADPIFTTQLVDYRDSAHGIQLVAALYGLADKRTDLPDPLPEPPPIPYEYLHRIGAVIHDSAGVPPGIQKQILFELRTALDEEDDPIIRDDIRNLLRALRERSDVTYPIARDIDTILGADPALPSASRGPAQAPRAESTTAAHIENFRPDTGAGPERRIEESPLPHQPALEAKGLSRTSGTAIPMPSGERRRASQRQRAKAPLSGKTPLILAAVGLVMLLMGYILSLAIGMTLGFLLMVAGTFLFLWRWSVAAKRPGSLPPR